MLPSLGVGLGYRPALRREMLRNLHEIDFLEVVSDSFFDHLEALRALASLKPIIPHSLGISVGSDPTAAYVEQALAAVNACEPPWFSDHLAFTHAGGVKVGHMAPVPHTEDSLGIVVRNVKAVQRQTRVPFALENIAVPFYWPHSTMSESEFLTEMVRRTGCYLLLDLENVRINSDNHGRAARDFLDNLPLERVAQVHVAGGTSSDGFEDDTHSAPVNPRTWDLLEYLCDLREPPAVLLERDQAFPPFGEILNDLRHARAILGCA